MIYKPDTDGFIALGHDAVSNICSRHLPADHPSDDIIVSYIVGAHFMLFAIRLIDGAL